MTKTIHSVDRVLGLIELLSQQPEGAGVGQIAQASGLPPSTVHRMLRVLCAAGYARQDCESDRYMLTPKLFEIGSRIVDRLDLRSVGGVHLRQLRAETSETAHLCVLDGLSALCIDSAVSPNRNRIDSPVGHRDPLHSTAVGKVLLAFARPEEAADTMSRLDLPRYTPRTICAPGELKQDLAITRDRGYALDWDENELGARCIGAPVFDHTGSLVAAVGISGPSVRLTDDRRDVLARCVVDAAENLSKGLGYHIALAELERRR
jgi:IclR family KDG regulon transcriptional repressor